MKINFNFLKHLDRTVNYECIVCKRRLRESKFMYISDSCGICRSCVDELPFVPVGRLFDGTKNISYFLSVFYYVGIIPSLIADYKFRGCKSYGNIFARFIRIGGIAPELLFVFCICFAYFEKKSVYYVTVGAVCGVLAGVLSGCAPFWLAAYIICVLSVSALAEVLYNGPFLLIFPWYSQSFVHAAI